VALAGVWFAALALRLIYLAELHGTPFFSVLIVDGQRYDAWALQIAGGNWLGSEVFYQTPLYPYLIACLYKLAGHQVFLVRLVQAVLGASSCVLLAIAGRRFLSPRAGLIAGLLLAIYPEAIFWDGLIQKSSLDLFLMTLLLATLGAMLPGPRRTWLIAAGVVMGAFMLNRENARILYPIVIWWLIAYFRDVPIRRRLAWAAVVTASTAAVLLPVGARNFAVGGEFLISTSQLGPNFYIGNHPGAQGAYEPLVAGHGNPLDERDDAKRLAEQAVGRPLSPTAISKYWFTRTVDEILREPVGAAPRPQAPADDECRRAGRQRIDAGVRAILAPVAGAAVAELRSRAAARGPRCLDHPSGLAVPRRPLRVVGRPGAVGHRVLRDVPLSLSAGADRTHVCRRCGGRDTWYPCRMAELDSRCARSRWHCGPVTPADDAGVEHDPCQCRS
jgi:hypothetical protein